MKPLKGGAAALAFAIISAAPPATGELAFEGRFEQGGLALGQAPPGVTAITLDGKPVPLAGDGRFLVGFDRDHPAAAMVEARAQDGRIIRRSLSIARRSWRIENIGVARRPSAATAEYLKRREAELGRIAAARRRGSDLQGWRQRFLWPARGRISGVFGSQRIYRGEPAAYHSGVDVAGGRGAPVLAPADGIVVLAGPPTFSLEGNLVIIDHGMGLNSAFLHLASTSVVEGQKVRQGQAIGTIGATGRATGPHLHWSVKWGDARLDPAALAGPMAP